VRDNRLIRPDVDYIGTRRAPRLLDEEPTNTASAASPAESGGPVWALPKRGEGRVAPL
jgi:hypothetical protein